jgi:hypothetical protein
MVNMRIVVMRAKEFPAAACARRGAGGTFGVGVGGSDGGGLHEQGCHLTCRCDKRAKNDK